jgi:hypothetical protein
MKTVTDIKKIERNAKIGKYANTGALIVLGIGLYISFSRPDQFAFSAGALLLGFFLSQLGMYYGNRWGRTPRPDEVIDKSMKGLGREYTIYHYVTPVSHLLLGPAGVWLILPYLIAGKVVYEKKRWKAKGGGFAQSYLRLFGQDNIGRPDLEASTEIESLTRYFKRVLPPTTEVPPIQVALFFAHPKVELQVEEAPLPVLTPRDLKDFMREAARQKPIGDLTLETIRQALPKADQSEA